MHRLLSAIALLAVLSAPAFAQSPDQLLQQSRDFGTLVGQAVKCGVDPAQVQGFVDATLPQAMPTTADSDLNEQMNQAFEAAMRAAPAAQNCAAISTRVTGGQ